MAMIWGSQTQRPTGARSGTSKSEGEWVLGKQLGRVGIVVDCHVYALPTGRQSFLSWDLGHVLPNSLIFLEKPRIYIFTENASIFKISSKPGMISVNQIQSASSE